MYRDWEKIGAIGGWVYTFVTALILIVGAYQTYLIRENNIVSQRAFVYTDGWRISVGKTTQGEWLVYVNYILSNTGNTPTTGLKIFSRCAVSATEIPEPYVLLFKEPSSVSQIIGPHAAVPMFCNFSEQQAEDMGAGKLFGYVLGEVSYHDKLEPSVEHVTQYAVALFHPVFTKAGTDFSFTVVIAPIGQHNCTDEDCQREPPR